MDINFGTLVEWLLYNVHYQVQLSVGTFVSMTPINKIGRLLYKLSRKQFSSQKNAYCAQVEALNLSKKDNETVRHFALKVQQLVEKGWCNKIASSINL